MRNLFSKFLNSTNGNIAIATAVVAPVILVAAGGAIDYSLAVQKSQELRTAADNAALAAVKEAYITYVDKHDQSIDLNDLIQKTAFGVFESEISQLNVIENASLNATAAIQNNRFSVDVAYSGDYETAILGIIGLDTITVGGVVTATESAASYINVNLLFDVSHSMGIGATENDQKIMVKKIGCAFACHIGGSSNSRYRRAQNAGAQMRVDAAKLAAIEAIKSIESKLSQDSLATISVYKFDNILYDVVPVGDNNAVNFNHIKSKIQNDIELTSWLGGTNIEYALESLIDEIPANGSGRTPDDRTQYVIVLTDGIESTQAYNGRWIPHQYANVNYPSMNHAKHETNYALNAKVCEKLRANGVEIRFIYTEYDYPYGGFRGHDQKRFGFIEDTLFEEVTQRFKECAGDSRHIFLAKTLEEIEQAFSALLNSFYSPLRLQ